MSQSENVRLLLAMRDAQKRGDLDAVAELVHPDFEMARIQGGPESGEPPLRGREAFRSWLEPDVLASFWIELVKFYEQDDLVAVEAVGHGVFRDSGIELDQPTWLIFRFRDGLPVRMDSYTTKADAVAAAGLEGAWAEGA
jgi:ketosteroid isomerase-like protein